MFTTNFERAFKNHEAGIRLKFEYYDEAKTDVRELARSLAFNDEVYAVIGGLYSSNAAILAAELTIVGKHSSLSPPPNNWFVHTHRQAIFGR